MFLSPYDTTKCKSYILTDTIAGIEKARVGSESQVVPLNWNGTEYYSIKMIVPGLSEIRPFAHPLLVVPYYVNDKEKSKTHQKEVVVDMRNFMRLDRDRKPVISGHSDYKLNAIRSLLQVIWMSERYRDLYNAGSFAMTLYVRWLSTLFVRRLTLPPDVQQNVTIIIGYFYASLFEDLPAHVEKHDERTINKMAISIAAATYCNVGDVMKRLDTYPVVRDLEGMLMLLREHSGSQRFDNFELLTLFQMLGGSFYGAKIEEILAVGLEHPPTWLTIAYLAATDSSYRKVTIGDIAANRITGNEDENFANNIGALCRSVREVDYSPRVV